MEKCLKISPEELFFIGKQMGAKYIDYDYVRMMKDIRQQYALREKEILDGLVRKGLLMEDFSGNMELDEDVKAMLMPVFFGEFESEASLTGREEKEAGERYKFHFYEGTVTQVSMEKQGLTLFPYGEAGIHDLEERLIPETYEAAEEFLPLEMLDGEQAIRILVLRNMHVGRMARNSQLVEIGNAWYLGQDENQAKCMTKSTMRAYFREMLRGGEDNGVL